MSTKKPMTRREFEALAKPGPCWTFGITPRPGQATEYTATMSSCAGTIEIWSHDAEHVAKAVQAFELLMRTGMCITARLDI